MKFCHASKEIFFGFCALALEKIFIGNLGQMQKIISTFEKYLGRSYFKTAYIRESKTTLTVEK